MLPANGLVISDDSGPATAEAAKAGRFEPQALDLLDHAPVGIHCVDANGIIQWANQTELQFLGYDADEYVGQPISKFHADAPVLEDILCRLRRGETLHSSEARLRHKDGSIRIGSISSNVVWKEGQFVHTRCFTRDVTAAVEDGLIKGALYRFADRLQRAGSLADVYDAALIAIEDALRCHRSSILLFDEADSMRFVAWRGLSEQYRLAVDGHSPWSRDSVSAVPILINSVEQSTLSDELKRIVLDEGINSLAFIPLVSNGRLIGKFMTYFDTPFEFSQDHIDLCLSIAHQVAFSVQRKRAELALATSERRFRDLMDALPAAVYTTDGEGRITHFNPAAEALAGRTPKLGVDQWCVSWKLYWPDGTPLPLDECPMAVALKEGRSIRGVEAILEKPDGTRRWFAPYPTPLKDPSGKVVGGINMLVDITERKQIEQDLAHHARQLALVTNNAPVYIAQCDRDSRYSFVNEPHAQRFGLCADDLKGRHIADVLGPDAFAVIKPHIDKVLRGDRVEFDVAVQEPIRGPRTMHCSYAPEFSLDGEVSGWVAAIVDITQRIEIEQALRDSEEKLKQAHLRKDEFLAMLSHELRNPLAPIANAVHLLRGLPVDNPVFTQARAIIQRQTGRLTRLVDDLLEVSRISTGRIQLQQERIPMAGVIERSVESTRTLIDQRRHTLTVSLPAETAWLNGDSARLEQVLVNLLTNACKYTDEGGAIQLSAEITSNKLIIQVRDNGIGIPPDLLPHVFELFTQSERALDRSQGGLGIGLALVERIVSMHGGTVSVISQLGNGSTFTVTLPLADPPPMPVNPEFDALFDASDKTFRVLIVDDNVDAAKSLAILLESCGHRTWVVHDGVEALKTAPSCQPQVALLDIGLPQMDGYELVKALRTAGFDRTLCVAITGYGQPSDRERALSAGFDLHLVKPVDFGKLQEVLEAIPIQESCRSPS
jgi:two-component system CheB/CheR fusion protein